MDFRLEPISPKDREQIIDIFNYYIENSFAAYLEEAVPYEAFDMMMKMTSGHPTVAAKDESGKVLGFAMLRPYNPMPAFSGTVEISYFLKPECRGKGLGSAMLAHLMDEAERLGIRVILASISSRNEPSIAFHRKHGFEEVGRFEGVGKKRNEPFDLVWMQKSI